MLNEFLVMLPVETQIKFVTENDDIKDQFDCSGMNAALPLAK